MTPSEKYLKKLGVKDQDTIPDVTNKKEENENSRRSFFKRSAMGGIALGGAFMFSPLKTWLHKVLRK
jgi:hypothetical protein